MNILCLTTCFARGTEIAEENVFPFSAQRAKRERPNALRELFKSITACPKGITKKKGIHTVDFDVTPTRAYISLIFVREAVRLNSPYGGKIFWG